MVNANRPARSGVASLQAVARQPCAPDSDTDLEFEDLLRASSLGAAMADAVPQDRATDDEITTICARAGVAHLPSWPGRTDPDSEGSEAPVGPGRDEETAVWRLVERAQAGEAEAFGLIYDRYVDTVFRFVYFRVGNRQLAEDLTADTFLHGLKRIGNFTWHGRDLGAWLVTIARNLVEDHFRSGRSRLEVTTGDVTDADRDRRPERNPEAWIVDHITDPVLLTAVRRLSPEQQKCIVLYFLQGFSVAEAARAMRKSEGAFRALQYRAVRTLARLLPDGFQP
ncbi:sigma-70 family RNA polymerase sigma factor [Micromonospora sp. NPDC051196]|uniref:sigma-70 family RNA polymerase sigma factor n=1 Tax=Micromonospora sp. NPDC051196 TaxID=3155281 RepID=UPI0034364599